MPGNDGAASLHCVALRVTALNSTGVPATNNAMYVTNNLTRLDFAPDVETGPEISDRNAAGQLAVVFRLPDLIKRLTATVEIVVPDPELEVILSGGNTFTSGANVEGFQYPALAADSLPNGVSIEAWTRAVVNGRQPTDYPYWRWAFPKLWLRKAGRTIDINRLASVFEGFAYENPNWGSGPRADFSYDTSRVVNVMRDTTIPTVQLGAQKV
jgi:hypothetical protein